MMGKLHNNEKGFGAIEGLLIVVVVVLIGVVGYMVYKNHNKATNNAVTTNTTATKPATSTPTNTTKTQTAAPTTLFKSNDGIFQFSYLTSWNSDSGFTNSCGMFTCVGSIALSLNSNNNHEVSVNEVKSSLAPKDWFNNVVKPFATSSSNSTPVNGYDTYYVKQDPTSNSEYTDLSYTLSHNGYILYINYNEGSTTDNKPVPSNPQNEAAFTALVQTVKFLN